MRVNTSKLKDAALDWSVCMAKGLKPEDIYIQKWGYLRASLYRRNRNEDGELDGSYTTGPNLLFSEKWEAGGPIIDREGISTQHTGDAAKWRAHVWNDKREEFWPVMYGSTQLIAAMRCYVASKLGEEVEIPEELYANC